MNMKHEKCRVLALDIRPQRAGYAVFENPKQLLDAGIIRFSSLEKAGLRLSLLMMTYRPDVLVLRKPSIRNKRNHSDTRQILLAAFRLAQRNSIEVVQITDRQFSEYIGAVQNKHETASRLAKLFPQLTWRLPPPRRTWQSERRSMALFDAVAYGMTYFAFTQESESQMNLCP